MSEFPVERVFRADPKVYRLQLAIFGGLGALAANAYCYLGRGETNWKAYAFANGIVIAIFVIRYFSMVGFKGPDALVLNKEGVSLDKGKSRRTIPWTDIEKISYKFFSGGHYWEFQSQTEDDPMVFFVDGLTQQQLNELRQVIAGLPLSENVLDLAA